MNDACPPVLLLLFNRPDNARRLLEHVRPARPARLYVSVDGPRLHKPGEAALVEQVRAVVSEVDWDCQVLTRFATENRGCKHGPAGGISWFFEHEEMGIVLEDDCLPDPTFFPFCAELLERYRSDERVMMISGDDFVGAAELGCRTSYHVHKYQLIWGWATWRRAWERIDLDMAEWAGWGTGRRLGFLSRHCATLDERLCWLDNFDRVADPAENTVWDYQWLFAMWRHGGVCLSPSGNLVSNVGFGGDATHTVEQNENHDLETRPMAFPLAHPDTLAIDLGLQEAIRRRFYMPRRRGLTYVLAWAKGRALRALGKGRP